MSGAAASVTSATISVRSRDGAGTAAVASIPADDRARHGHASDDGELDRLHRSYAATADRTIRSELAARYDGFARRLAYRFPGRRESREDLVQVARMGLLLALDRFDPERSRPFQAFARVTINGELKRHLRDHSWSVRVPRSLQEDFLVVMRALDDLTQELGRCPRIDEIAARTGLNDEQVLEATEVGAVYRPLSVDLPDDDGGPRMDLGVNDTGFGLIEGRALLNQLLLHLSERDREVFRLHYVDGLTQVQIGVRCGVSQMCVSRILTKGLARMRVLARVTDQVAVPRAVEASGGRPTSRRERSRTS